jgi:CobQ-like glutamine amidotransferase family enzyme
MKLYIAYLYSDLMNLYGENGNIKALKYAFNSQGVNVIIDSISIGSNFNLDKYDVLYIGMGTEDNQRFVLKDILKHKKEIKEYIESGKTFISTGNSIELFGKSINEEKALNIFKYTSRKLDKRLVGDVFVTDSNINEKIIGFQNRGSIIENNEYPLHNEDDNLGVKYKNFFGTYVIGPILVRNPELLKEIASNVIKSKEEKFKFRSFDLKLNKQAYKNYLETYYGK